MLLGVDVDWEKEPHWFRYGTGIIKNKYQENIITPNDEVITVERSRWESDLNIPLFWDDRSYIAQYV
jgi:tRNA(His) 5'-end guanylyltransferase